MFVFLRIVNVECERMLGLCDPNQCQNVEEPLFAFSNVPLNATLFKGELLKAYESQTIPTISGRNFINQS